MRSINRWWIAVAGICLQMALGAAYAWSVFRIPLGEGIRMSAETAATLVGVISIGNGIGRVF